MAARTVALICAELQEAVFQIRETIPLTWHGAAAEQFVLEIEQAIIRLEQSRQTLSTSAGLIQLHEQRMRMLSQSMGAGG